MISKSLHNYPLVSIVSPCFNGEHYVSRFLDSVLNQTYQNIELILINDGSSDNTESVILSYEGLFRNRGYSFIYITQQNSGQAAAINKGLEIFKGSYLTWPDSDDVLHPENIRLKVEFLQHNESFDMVLCKARIIDEKSQEVIGSLERDPDIGGDLFLDLITERNVYFAPGGYMVRSQAFFELFPNRNIIEDKAGQNWQILLPFAFYKKCGYIQEFLLDYYLRQGSHSRKETTLEQQLKKFKSHERLLLKVIDSLKPENINTLYHIVNIKYIRRRFHIYIEFNDLHNAFAELFRLFTSTKFPGYECKVFIKKLLIK